MENKVIDVVRHSLGHKGFDYDQMTDDVFLGTNMCCQFGFDRELLTKNVRADISLEEDRIDAPYGVDYFLWLPTKNHAAPKPDQLAFGVQALEFFIDRKIRVYIHCQQGHGRAPTLFAAYLVKKGREVNEAIEQVKAKRPAIHINETQLNALRLYQQSLKA